MFHPAHNKDNSFYPDISLFLILKTNVQSCFTQLIIPRAAGKTWADQSVEYQKAWHLNNIFNELQTYFKTPSIKALIPFTQIKSFLDRLQTLKQEYASHKLQISQQWFSSLRKNKSPTPELQNYLQILLEKGEDYLSLFIELKEFFIPQAVAALSCLESDLRLVSQIEIIQSLITECQLNPEKSVIVPLLQKAYILLETTRLAITGKTPLFQSIPSPASNPIILDSPAVAAAVSSAAIGFPAEQIPVFSAAASMSSPGIPELPPLIEPGVLQQFLQENQDAGTNLGPKWLIPSAKIPTTWEDEGFECLGTTFYPQGITASQVWKGTVKHTNGEVPAAFKQCFELSPTKRLLEEAQKLADYHAARAAPEIIQLYGIYIKSQDFYLALELMSSDLLRFLKKHQNLHAKDLESITIQISSALDCLHKKGYIHRDIKTNNVFIRFNGTICLGDCLTLMPCQAGERIRTSDRVGSPVFNDPDIYNPRYSYSHKTDLYALGVLIFHMVTGDFPFDGDANTAMYAVSRAGQSYLQQYDPQRHQYYPGYVYEPPLDKAKTNNPKLNRLVEIILQLGGPADVRPSAQQICEHLSAVPLPPVSSLRS